MTLVSPGAGARCIHAGSLTWSPMPAHTRALYGKKLQYICFHTCVTPNTAGYSLPSYFIQNEAHCLNFIHPRLCWWCPTQAPILSWPCIRKISIKPTPMWEVATWCVNEDNDQEVQFSRIGEGKIRPKEAWRTLFVGLHKTRERFFFFNNGRL